MWLSNHAACGRLYYSFHMKESLLYFYAFFNCSSAFGTPAAVHYGKINSSEPKSREAIFISLIQYFETNFLCSLRLLVMESKPKCPVIRNNPENFYTCHQVYFLVKGNYIEIVHSKFWFHSSCDLLYGRWANLTECKCDKKKKVSHFLITSILTHTSNAKCFRNVTLINI